MSPPDQIPLPAGTRIGNYVIVQELGRGGFGIVYEGRHLFFRDPVAIKEFYPVGIAKRQGRMVLPRDARDLELYSTVRERFKEIANLQRQFDHPSILQVVDFSVLNNTGYMITRLVNGESLEDFLRKNGGHLRSEEQFREVFEPILSAVEYVHSRDCLHRDISPANIMIDPTRGPVLIDFGAMKRDLSSSERYTSIIVLNEAYAPPEQKKRQGDPPLGFHTDVFALAGTMYRCLAGKLPELPSTREGADRGIDPYVPVAQVQAASCPPEICEAIDRGLRLNPDERPQSIAEFRAM